MMELRSSLKIPQSGKIFFDNNANIRYDNEIKAFELNIDNEPVLNIDKDGISPITDININIIELNGEPIATGDGIIDAGTLRICPASDSTFTIGTVSSITNKVAVTLDTTDIANGPIPISLDTANIANGPIPISLDTANIANGPIPISLDTANIANGPIPISLDTANIANGPIPISLDTANIANGPIPISLDTTNIANGPISTSISNFPATQNVNLTQILGTATTVGSGIIDNGTQRVVLPTDQPTISTQLDKIKTTVVSTAYGTVDAGTQRMVLTDDYVSKTTTKKPIDFLNSRKAQLYFDASITGGAISHNLALNLTLSSASAPIVTSIAFEGGSAIFISSIEVYVRSNGGAPGNVGWGNSTTPLTSGFGIYYKVSSGGSTFTIVNNNTATNQLPSDAIKSNGGFFRSFERYELFDPGAGDLLLKFYKTYNPPIEITNTGGYYFTFAKEDLTAGSTSLFYVYVNYYS